MCCIIRGKTSLHLLPWTIAALYIKLGSSLRIQYSEPDCRIHNVTSIVTEAKAVLQIDN